MPGTIDQLLQPVPLSFLLLSLLMTVGLITSLRITAQLRHRIAQSEEGRLQLEKQASAQQAELKLLRLQLQELDAMRAALVEAEGELRDAQARYETSQQGWREKQALLERGEERLSSQFERLAHQIFEQKSAQFSHSSDSRLQHLLEPFREQISAFQQQVQQIYSNEARERHTLEHELKRLQQLNSEMSQETANLVRALKGDTRQQGRWGEVILERILSESGLREGHEYQVQLALHNDEGKAFRPDVVVNLPDDKAVIIDSKVSLTAYERYMSSEDELTRRKALEEHVSSLRGHIRGLGAKAYQDLQGIRSLDYVLLFIPVEPAFMLAIEQEPALVNLALEHNIMLVSPTTLLVALRTVTNLWRVEYQGRNAQQIADRAGRLYDKLHGFIDDLQGVGKALTTAEQSYQQALKKLSTGKGNLVSQAEKLRLLGAENRKQIAPELAESAVECDQIASRRLQGV